MKKFYTDFEEQFFVEQKLREICPELKTIGNTCRMRCRICGDSIKNKSKMRGNYYKRTNSYSCFNEGCTASGLFIIAAFEQRNIKDVRDEFLKSLNLIEDVQTIKPKKLKNTPKIIQNKSIQIKEEWLELTGKNLETIKKRGVLTAINSPKNWKLYYDTKLKRIIIPWMKYKEIQFYQSRATLKSQNLKYIYPKDLEKPIFNLDKITQNIDYIFCLEGAFDAVFIENGIAMGTTKLTEKQFNTLSEQYPFHKIIIILDNQNTDTAARDILLKECVKNPKQLYFIWPKYIKEKDINEYMINNNFKSIFTPEFIIKNSFKNSIIKAKLILNK